ncbi:MAG: autotransporter domain-containing protein [Candidatus Rickettsia vulgarisii]
MIIGFDSNIGIRHSRYKNSSYSETGTQFLGTHVSSKPSNKTEGVIGGRILTNVKRDSMLIIPEGHVTISRILGKKRGKVNSIFEGMSVPFINKSDRTSKTLYNLGASVTAKRGRMEYSVGYDAYLAKKYIRI